jgi:hypothetical protein
MTILGQHTVAETRDLIRAQEFRINKNVQQLQRIQARRLSPPTAAQLDLDTQMGAFLKEWTNTRDKETLFMTASVVSNPLIPAAAMPAESSYKAIIHVLHERIPHFKEIEQHVDAEARSIGLPPTDLSGIPGQNSPDVDFVALGKLDAAIAATGNPLGKPGGTDSIAKSPLGLIFIGGAILAVIGGGLYVKTVFRL